MTMPRSADYLSALANAAALNGKAHAYLVWGIEDGSHRVLGTAFDPATERKGNEPLESWLLRLLNPKLDFRFDAVEVEGAARRDPGDRAGLADASELQRYGVHPYR